MSIFTWSCSGASTAEELHCNRTPLGTHGLQCKEERKKERLGRGKSAVVALSSDFWWVKPVQTSSLMHFLFSFSCFLMISLISLTGMRRLFVLFLLHLRLPLLRDRQQRVHRSPRCPSPHNTCRHQRKRPCHHAVQWHSWSQEVSDSIYPPGSSIV